MTSACIDAFCAALTDICEVQSQALNSAYRFRDTDIRFIQAIARQMDQETLSSKYAMIQILIAIAAQKEIDLKIRQEILELLLQKMKHPANHEDVYIFRTTLGTYTKTDGSEGISELGKSIDHVGMLTHEIFRGILDVTGVAAQLEA